MQTLYRIDENMISCDRINEVFLSIHIHILRKIIGLLISRYELMHNAID